MNPTRRALIGTGLAATVMFTRRAEAAYAMAILAPYYKSLLTMAPIAIALERGCYGRHGIDVTGVETSVGGGTSLRNMIGGDIGYGELGTASVLAGFKAGIDVRIVHESVGTSADIVWVAMPNSGIRTIKDLAGKRVGISAPRSTSEMLITMAADAAGVGGKLKLIAIGQLGNGLSALENGGVDATLIMEPLYTERLGKYRVVVTQDGLPRTSSNVGVATLDFIHAHPRELRGLIAGRRDAVDFLYANIDESARIVSDRYGVTLPSEVAPAVMRHLAEIRYWSRGDIDLPSIDIVVKGLMSQGLWDGPVDWSRIIDDRFLSPDPSD